MAISRLVAHILVWILTLAFANGKTPEVHMMTCLLSEDCVLPCQFQPAKNWSVTWYKQEGVIYSLSSDGSQHQQQAPQLSNRTAVTREQVANGNASLLLRHCTVKDKGKYKCRVKSIDGRQDSIVILRVEGPVNVISLKMIEPDHRQMNCSIKDIYPGPFLQWSTDPPLPLHALRSLTHTTTDKQGLFSIYSILDLVANFSEYTYICTVNNSYGTKTWRVSLKETDMNAVQGQALTIPCRAPRSVRDFGLTWAFIKAGKPSVFLTFNSHTGKMTNSWADRAQVDLGKVQSGDGSLQLNNVQGQEIAGTYMCNFSAIHNTHLVYTNVRMAAKATGEGHTRVGIIIGVIIALITLGAALLIYAKIKGVFYSWRLMPETSEHSGLSRTKEDKMETADTKEASV